MQYALYFYKRITILSLYHRFSPPQPFVHFYFLAKKRRALNSCANLLFFFPHQLQILPHLPPKHRNILIQHLQHLAQRIHRHADLACLYPAQRTLIQTAVPRQILLLISLSLRSETIYSPITFAIKTRSELMYLPPFLNSVVHFKNLLGKADTSVLFCTIHNLPCYNILIKLDVVQHRILSYAAL